MIDAHGDRNAQPGKHEDVDPHDPAFALLFSHKAKWRSRTDLSNLQATVSLPEADRMLSILRNSLDTMLDFDSSGLAADLYFLAYDCGVAAGLYGAKSAVCVGINKGLDDALHMTQAEVSLQLLDQAKVLGGRHGALIRGLMRRNAVHPAQSASLPGAGQARFDDRFQETGFGDLPRRHRA